MLRERVCTHVERAQVRQVVRGLHVDVLRRVVGSARGVGGAELLDAVGITQRVERVFTRRHGGRDHGDHARARLVADEAVAQHLRQLRHPERKVVVALHAQCADALFQR